MVLEGRTIATTSTITITATASIATSTFITRQEIEDEPLIFHNSFFQPRNRVTPLLDTSSFLFQNSVPFRGIFPFIC